MSELLDELARTLATSMPRRRALRTMGGVLVTATLPLLRPGPGTGATTQAKTCADYKEGPTCPKLCCRDCPPVPSGGNPGVLKWCCNTGDDCDFEDPSEQYQCGRVRCKPQPCKTGQKKCNDGHGGTLCCDADEFCASNRKSEGSGAFSFGVCCKKGQSFCLRGAPARPFCCPRGTRCCNAGTGGGTGGLVAAACCSRLTQVCERGSCRCKPGHTVRCGKDCCHPGRHKCCGTVHKRCVPRDTDCGDAFPNA